MTRVVIVVLLVCLGCFHGYAQDPWSKLNQYLRFDDYDHLNQLWLLEEQCDECDSTIVRDTVMLHVWREGRRVIIDKLSGAEDFPFKSASASIDSISHVQPSVHMGVEHQTRFRLCVDSGGTIQSGHVLGVLRYKDMLHLMPSVVTLNPNEIHDYASRIRTYQLMHSSPFDRPDRSMIVPISCIESVGKWKVVESRGDPHPFDTIVVALRQGYVDIELITITGDTILSMSLTNDQIVGGSDSWGYNCPQSTYNGVGSPQTCKFRFSGASDIMGITQVRFYRVPGSGTDQPSYITWHGMVTPVAP